MQNCKYYLTIHCMCKCSVHVHIKPGSIPRVFCVLSGAPINPPRLTSHGHCVLGESAGRQAAWGAGQQGHLGVGGPALADGAVVLPAPTCQVLSQPPPPPPPLDLMLHLESHPTACSNFQKTFNSESTFLTSPFMKE